MHKIIPFLFTALLFTACNNSNKQINTTPTAQVMHLNNATLYNTDSIKLALGTSSAEQEVAKKKFLEAIDLYKNKKDAALSIPVFKTSLFIYPSEKTYFELASALAENKNYEESLQALTVAEQMDYSPLANIMYKKAVVFAAMPNTKFCADGWTKVNDSIALRYMQVALQMGYAKPKDFLSDKTFDSIRINKDWEFKTVYQNAMSGNKDPEKLAWENYKNEFKQITLPLTINATWTNQQKLENAIGYDYEKFVPEMRTGKFSREVENEYFYVGSIKDDSAYTALLYAGKNLWVSDGKGGSPVYFYMVTYSPQGKIIDKMQVGGQKNFTDNFKTLVLKENLTLEVKDFKNIYEKDPGKNGYEDNKVTKSELLTTKYYRITLKGKFEKEDRQLAILGK